MDSFMLLKYCGGRQEFEVEPLCFNAHRLCCKSSRCCWSLFLHHSTSLLEQVEIKALVSLPAKIVFMGNE